MLSWILILIFIFLAVVLLGFIISKKIDEGTLKKSYTKLTLLLTILSFASVLIITTALIMNLSLMEDTRNALQAQAEGIAPIDPDLRIDKIDVNHNKFFFDSSLVQLNHLEDWTFWLQKESIDFAVVNRGQRETGDLHFYLIDLEGEFIGTSQHLELFPLDSDYFSIDLRFNKCRSGTGKEEFYQIKSEGCNNSEISEGLKQFFLEVDCKKCLFETNPRCYSFNICIYNQTQQSVWCEENFKDEDFELIEVQCP